GHRRRPGRRGAAPDRPPPGRHLRPQDAPARPWRAGRSDQWAVGPRPAPILSALRDATLYCRETRVPRSTVYQLYSVLLAVAAVLALPWYLWKARGGRKYLVS